MSDDDPPVAADDFPEFGEPPQQVPRHARAPQRPSSGEPADGRQEAVDAIIARLRREKAEARADTPESGGDER